MPRLSHADLDAVVGLLGEACKLEGAEPFPASFLEQLQDLVPCTLIQYQFMDRPGRAMHAGVNVGDGADRPELEERGWDLIGECPTLGYRDRSGDLSAIRNSDVLSRRQWHALALHSEYFREYGLEYVLQVGLPAPVGLDRLIILLRTADERDFSERDRDVLDVLRPQLVRMHELADLRARAAADERPDALTPREREIVDLVAQGRTNAQIATTLWVAPSTVKKHLENVYEKLGVTNRTAAAAARR